LRGGALPLLSDRSICWLTGGSSLGSPVFVFAFAATAEGASDDADADVVRSEMDGVLAVEKEGTCIGRSFMKLEAMAATDLLKG
jgi:hypothetical protein